MSFVPNFPQYLLYLTQLQTCIYNFKQFETIYLKQNHFFNSSTRAVFKGAFF